MPVHAAGLNAFGFNDVADVQEVIAGPAENAAGRDGLRDLPACVVLTGARGSTVLTGAAAAASRVHTGFHWPEESRLPDDVEELRRLPVGLLWERLVTGRGRPSEIGGHPVEELVRAHVDAVLPPAEGRRRVVAVPNMLSTASQERFLKAFGVERGNVALLWRPVAAVLAWLDGIGREAFRPFEGVRNAWAGVCYIGIDGVEFTRIGLDFSRDDFVVPVRSRPQAGVGDAGIDGFGLLGELLHDGEHAGEAERWQAALRFPDLWRLASGRSPEGREELWSRNGRWAVWSAAGREPRRRPDGHCAVVPFADDIAGRSPAEREERRKAVSDSGIRLYLAGRKAFTNGSEAGTCLGLVVCGALAPEPGSRPMWLTALARECGVGLSDRPGILCAAPSREDLAAKGCRIYGERLLHNEACTDERDRLPTYFDTLPQMRLYVAAEDRLVWKPLFESDRCEGGKSVENTLDVFALRSGSTSVEIWLMMIDEDVEPEALGEDVTEDLERTPYSFAEVSFVRSHPEEIRLLLTASMQPSSGFASVSFTPRDTKFNDILKREGVFLTIDDMVPKRASELPRMKLSWPLDGRRETFSRESGRGQGINTGRFVEDFLWSLRIGDTAGLKRAVQKKKKIGGDEVRYVYFIDEEGRQDVVDEAVWRGFLRKAEERCGSDKDWMNIASWLWRGCPSGARRAIFGRLSEAARNSTLIRYAARVAGSERDVAMVLSKVEDYLLSEKDDNFRPGLADAATRLLDMNPKAAEVLARDPAMLAFFLKRIARNVDRLSDPSGEDVSLKKYQWIPMLLAGILKVRRWRKDFLRDPEEVRTWVERIERLGPAVDEFVRRSGRKPRLAEVLKASYAGIIGYIQGCGNDVPLLMEDIEGEGKEE